MAFGALKNPADASQSAIDDARAESVIAAFKTLLDGLSPDLQERVRASLFESFPQNSTARPGQVLGTILKFVPRDRAFTIEEVKRKIEAEGIQATAKAIYNALGYLTRKRRIQRVGHGRYIVEGVLLETADDLGVGPPTRHEIDDT